MKAVITNTASSGIMDKTLCPEAGNDLCHCVPPRSSWPSVKHGQSGQSTSV